MSETMLISGKIISKKLFNNNADIRRSGNYFITLDLNKINIPEIGLKDYKNTVTILTMFPYISEKDPEYEKTHNITGKHVAISCSRFSNIYVANPKSSKEHSTTPVSYTEKAVIRNELHNFTFCSGNYLSINSITCLLAVDRHDSVSNVYSCRISNSNLSDVDDENGRVYFREIPVIFKLGTIKPAIGKEYIVIGSIVNFPSGYHTPKGRHGIYAEIIKEIPNEGQRDTTELSV